MKRLRGVLATTHVDLHGDKLTLSALESAADQIRRQYVPFILQHDPRIPPLGRVIGAVVRRLDDGEHALEGEVELFEPGDDIPLADDERQIPIRTYPSEALEIASDRGFRDEADQRLVREIGALFKTKPQEEVRKALEPISILAIGGSFILGGIAAGFLGRLGQDGYEFLRTKLQEIFSRRPAAAQDHLLLLELVVQAHPYDVTLDVILTNPSPADIESLFDEGLKALDALVPQLLAPDVGLKKLVFQYSHGRLKMLFGVRRDGVPLDWKPHEGSRDA